MAAALGGGILQESRAETTAKVVLIRNAGVLGSDNKVQGEILQSMLDEAVKNLQGTNEPLEAWQTLFKSSDVVGVKSNEWQRLPTPKELETAIKRRLLDVGVAEKNMDIADRGVLKNPILSNLRLLSMCALCEPIIGPVWELVSKTISSLPPTVRPTIPKLAPPSVRFGLSLS